MLKKFILALAIAVIVLAGCSSTAKKEAAIDVDVDLTKLNSNMVYAQVNDMMTSPQNYMNKTIRVKGKSATYFNEKSNKNYYAIIIADTMGCCKQGIEFAWDKDSKNKYPKADSYIELRGTFKSYTENGKTYYYISAANLKRDW